MTNSGWELMRQWTRDPPVCFLMLNPSTADATKDDATIRRCIGYAKRWKFGGLVVANLFALRSTDPRALLEHPDPVGPENDLAIAAAVSASGVVVCAWGAHAAVRRRDAHVLRLVRAAGRVPLCLTTTNDGYPSHPLRLRHDLELRAYAGRN